MTIIAENKKARFDYEIIETFEAGIVLTGPEIKSIRDSRVNLKGSFIGKSFSNNCELFVRNMHITPFPMADTPQDPVRERKLLLHRKEIDKIQNALNEKGMAVVPLTLKLKRRYAKLVIAIGKGRKKHDKREVMKKRSQEIDMRRLLKH